MTGRETWLKKQGMDRSRTEAVNMRSDFEGFHHIFQ